MRRRVFCYITRPGPDGPELLVFRHDDPAAGIQTPGGTLDGGETAIDGARREACEETGLFAFSSVHLIAVDIFDHPTDPVERHHVHLTLSGPTADRWTHRVTAGEADTGLLFHHFWLTFPDAKIQVLAHMVSHLDIIADRMTGATHVKSIS